jgi:hypothetical protein
MTTLADLKTRIISETVRDDLADDLATQFDVIIRGAIEEWATQHFYFNEGRVTLPTVALNPTVIVPPSIRIIDSLWITVGGSRYQLLKRSIDEIEDLQVSPTNGQPAYWAEFAGNMVIWPTPNIVYPLIVICVQDVLPVLDFTDGASSNAWTTVGQDLITATSKKRLYRDYLSAVAQDPRLDLAIVQETEAANQLFARSNRKIATGRIRPGW